MDITIQPPRDKLFLGLYRRDIRARLKELQPYSAEYLALLAELCRVEAEIRAEAREWERFCFRNLSRRAAIRLTAAPEPQRPTTPRVRPRARRSPLRAATVRSSARSGDSGDDGPSSGAPAEVSR